MGVGVAAHLTAQLHHPAHGLRARGHIPAHLEEGGQGVVLLQDVQDLVGAGLIGTVVKGKGHHGHGGIDHPDVGLLRLRRGGGLLLGDFLRLRGLGSNGVQRRGLAGGRIGRGGPSHARGAGQQQEKGEKKRIKTVHYMDFLRRYLT